MSRCAGFLMMKTVCWVALMALILTSDLAAQPAAPPHDARLAQLSTGNRADWQQWDGFLTTVVKKLAGDLPESFHDQLGDVFMDSRYQLSQALSVGGSDPV